MIGYRTSGGKVRAHEGREQRLLKKIKMAEQESAFLKGRVEKLLARTQELNVNQFSNLMVTVLRSRGRFTMRAETTPYGHSRLTVRYVLARGPEFGNAIDVADYILNDRNASVFVDRALENMLRDMSANMMGPRTR